MTEKDLRRYLRQAEARLVCSPARRREFEAFARQSLEEFAAENPDADYTACLKQFGTPESTAAQFMENLPPEEVESWRKNKGHRNRLCIAGTVLVIVVLAGALIFYYGVKGIVTVERTTVVVENIPDDITVEELERIIPTPIPPDHE